jgi:Asp/Glu/hydantoin racemase
MIFSKGRTVRLNIVNLNSTAAMTAIIAEVAAKVARPGTVIRAVESEFGPASIEGYYLAACHMGDPASGRSRAGRPFTE